MLLEMHLLKVLVLEVNVRGVSQMDDDDGSNVYAIKISQQVEHIVRSSKDGME